MKQLALCLILAVVTGPALAANEPVLSPQLRKLDISVGRWVFHGRSLDTPLSKAGSWTWHEDCGWSANQLFLECSFDNEWSGKAVRSLVVDTWNGKDKSYWHYEFFAVGASGKRPFVSRMTIHGNTWTEYGSDEDNGKKIKERIVYVFTSPTTVNVKIEISGDSKHWITVDEGEGIKKS